MYTLDNYQEDKKFEEYLIAKQKIEASSSRIKDVLLQKLTTFFQTEKALTEILEMVV
jgi:hypothetical protein